MVIMELAASEILFTESMTMAMEFDAMPTAALNPASMTFAAIPMMLARTILLFLLLKPATPQPEDNTDLIQQIQHIQILSQISLEEADKCEFRPIDGGYVMTAYFPDGESASYLLIAEEDGNTYSLLSLNQ